jgi:hypothetical protein
MPSTQHDFTIYRGLTWAGLRCIALSASSEPVSVEGSTALLQARKAIGKPVAFALPVTLGQEAGEIIIPEVSAETTATLTRGAYVFDLILIGGDGKPWPPVMHGIITVRQPVSNPNES